MLPKKMCNIYQSSMFSFSTNLSTDAIWDLWNLFEVKTKCKSLLINHAKLHVNIQRVNATIEKQELHNIYLGLLGGLHWVKHSGSCFVVRCHRAGDKPVKKNGSSEKAWHFFFSLGSCYIMSSVSYAVKCKLMMMLDWQWCSIYYIVGVIHLMMSLCAINVTLSALKAKY